MSGPVVLGIRRMTHADPPLDLSPDLSLDLSLDLSRARSPRRVEMTLTTPRRSYDERRRCRGLGDEVAGPPVGVWAGPLSAPPPRHGGTGPGGSPHYRAGGSLHRRSRDRSRR